MNLKSIWDAYKQVIYLVVFLWIVFLVSRVSSVNSFGIAPRTMAGLPGIILAPFLHHDLIHIAENSAGLLVLGFFMILLEPRGLFYKVVPIIILGGAGTWLIGRADSVHLGASGLIFGMLGYLIAAGLFRRDLKSVLISVIVLLFYGGMIFGVLPSIPSVSWESHLCGFISGIITASGKKVRKGSN